MRMPEQNFVPTPSYAHSYYAPLSRNMPMTVATPATIAGDHYEPKSALRRKSTIEVDSVPISRRNVQKIGIFSLAKTPHYLRPMEMYKNGTTQTGHLRKVILSTNICPPTVDKRFCINPLRTGVKNNYLIRTQPFSEKNYKFE